MSWSQFAIYIAAAFHTHRKLALSRYCTCSAMYLKSTLVLITDVHFQ